MMDLLIVAFGMLFLGFYAGHTVTIRMIAREAAKIAMTKAEIAMDLAEESFKLVTLEQLSESTLAAYVDDKFVCQSQDADDLIDQVAAKYPDKSLQMYPEDLELLNRYKND